MPMKTKIRWEAFVLSFLLIPGALVSREVPIFGKVYQSFTSIVQNSSLLGILGLILAGFLIYFIWKNAWIRAAIVVAVGAIIADFVGVSEWIVGNPTETIPTSNTEKENADQQENSGA